MFKIVQILHHDNAIKLAEQVVSPRTARDKVKRVTEQADAAFRITTRRDK